MTTGRNFDEVLRVIDSLQLTANQIFGTWKEPKPYIRIVPDPATKA